MVRGISGVVGGLVAIALAILVGRWAAGGKEWREERKKHLAAWKERRKEMRQDHKDRMRAYKAGDYGWKKGDTKDAWEPSDLEKIIGRVYHLFMHFKLLNKTLRLSTKL